MDAATFASKTRPEGDCLVWTGERTKRGYGQFTEGGKKKYAHRRAWEQENGPIEDGLEVRHSCDNPPCVKVAHLLPGTHAQNMAEAGERGLLTREKCPQGHEYTPENKTPSGHCRICNRDKSRRFRQRRKAGNPK